MTADEDRTSEASTERTAHAPSEPLAPSPRSSVPDNALILVPVRGLVLFPGIILPVVVGRERSIAAAQEAVRAERPIGLILQRSAEDEEPAPADLHATGTVASLLRYLTTPDGTHHIVCQGETRFRVAEYLPGYPFLVARVIRHEEATVVTREAEARAHLLKQKAVEALQLLPQVPQNLVTAVQNLTSPPELADLVASYMDISAEEKQAILEIYDVDVRLERVLAHLDHRIEILRLSHEIGQQTKRTMEERQREFLLREQMRTIQRELGEADEKATEVADLDRAIAESGMSAEADQQARRELKRLERMPEASLEYSMVRTYLDWLVELPWKLAQAGPIDIDRARRTLDEDHYGLPKVKRRILEYLAVRRLAPEGKGPILCLVGPPGVGKTSLGQSIARATGRTFVRASLGGLHDEAEIRGHRRTYVGALPGNIIQGIRKASARDCVFMLDEVDKLGAGFHGDPASALLEVLDPEQNGSFRDNYLGVAFDLSRTMFICTANILDSIPGPLRDRMEVIELSGYTDDEKLHIARRYLVDRQLQSNGLVAGQLDITDDALRLLIRHYTREAGVRNLEREIGALCRSAAMRIAEGSAEKVRVGTADVPSILGARRYESEAAMRTAVPGVATGLAWTPVGGDILFVEASRVPGRGKLILTGQLGEVMKESAQAALSLVKGRARLLGFDDALFEKSDIHIHVPAGAIPKDGPSAGVAMYAALVSLLTNHSVRSDTAMTGEISLRGLVLPVGGIKEKVVAAVRAGLRTIILPSRNRKDFDEIPEEARRLAEFVWVDRVDEVTAAAIDLATIEESRLRRV